MLFEASQFLPQAAATINLAEPGPRACTRLWSALLEEMVFVDATVGGRYVLDAESACGGRPASRQCFQQQGLHLCIAPCPLVNLPSRSPVQAAAKEGKKAAELATALPPHLHRSLLFEVESSGLK